MKKDFNMIALHYCDWCSLVEKQETELKKAKAEKQRAERELKAELERRTDAKFSRPEFTRIESLRYQMGDWIVGFFVGQADIGWYAQCDTDADSDEYVYVATPEGLFRLSPKTFSLNRSKTSGVAPAALSLHDTADIDVWLDELISHFLSLKTYGTELKWDTLP